MLVTIPDVLKPDEVAHIRRVLEGTNWVDGRITAGDQAGKVKHNLQVPIGFTGRAGARPDRPAGRSAPIRSS